MLIAVPSRKSVEKKVWLFNWGLLAVLFLSALWVFLSFSLQKQNFFLPDRAGPPAPSTFSHDKIGWGPLGLNGLRSLGPVPGLARDLLLLGRNRRPDALHDAALLLGLKAAGVEKQIKSGQVVFLKREGQDAFSFSLEETDLSIQPLALEGDGVLVEVRSGGVKGDFLLKNYSPRPIEEREYVKNLKSAKGWGSDIFLQQFGGTDYLEYAKKYKIEAGKEVFFASEGDLFAWNGECWTAASYESAAGLPVAKVIRTTPRSIDVEVWDETGFQSQIVSLGLSQSPRIIYKPEELLTSVRPRSTAEFSALLGGKRRVVLKEGDWWLKTAAGWKNLKRIGDIEDFVHHKLQGELFIFEKIESDKGKTIVRGHYFDPMRTQMQPLALTLNADKKTGAKGGRDPRGSPMIAKVEEKPRIQVPQFQNKEGEAP